MSPCGLAWRQAELGITFTALNFASAGQRKQKDSYPSDPGTLQTLDNQKWKLQRKNLNHSMDVCAVIHLFASERFPEFTILARVTRDFHN
jgi:hypothetical protein